MCVAGVCAGKYDGGLPRQWNAESLSKNEEGHCPIAPHLDEVVHVLDAVRGPIGLEVAPLDSRPARVWTNGS